MNFRYGGSGYAYTKSGINLPALFVEMIIGNDKLKDISKEVTEEKTYVNERMLLDDLQARNISIRDFNYSIQTADIGFVPDEQDKLPERLFRLAVLKAIIKYLLKKVLRKN